MKHGITDGLLLAPVAPLYNAVQWNKDSGLDFHIIEIDVPDISKEL